MKITIASLLAILAASTAHAGSFGGPPPFSNGSALVTGVDGSYQATARATNVSGVFRFQYSGGLQTASTTKNNWVFFAGGQIQRGSVTASLDNSSVTGVLDSVAASTTTSNGSTSLPIILLNSGTSASGDFHGTMSPNGSFSGSGTLEGSPATTNQIIVVAEQTNGSLDTRIVTYSNQAGNLAPTTFRFNGVRLTTATSSSSTN